MGLTIDLSSPGGLVVALLPELVLTSWALVILLAAAWRHREEADQQLAGQLALLGLVSTLLVVFWLWGRGAHSEGIATMIALGFDRVGVEGIRGT